MPSIVCTGIPSTSGVTHGHSLRSKWLGQVNKRHSLKRTDATGRGEPGFQKSSLKRQVPPAIFQISLQYSLSFPQTRWLDHGSFQAHQCTSGRAPWLQFCGLSHAWTLQHDELQPAIPGRSYKGPSDHWGREESNAVKRPFLFKTACLQVLDRTCHMRKA